MIHPVLKLPFQLFGKSLLFGYVWKLDIPPMIKRLVYGYPNYFQTRPFFTFFLRFESFTFGCVNLLDKNGPKKCSSHPATKAGSRKPRRCCSAASARCATGRVSVQRLWPCVSQRGELLPHCNIHHVGEYVMMNSSIDGMVDHANQVLYQQHPRNVVILPSTQAQYIYLRKPPFSAIWCQIYQILLLGLSYSNMLQPRKNMY